MIETIDEAHLFRMLTAGIPSALDIALEARNLPFLSHPSVSGRFAKDVRETYFMG